MLVPDRGTWPKITERGSELPREVLISGVNRRDQSSLIRTERF